MIFLKNYFGSKACLCDVVLVADRDAYAQHFLRMPNSLTLLFSFYVEVGLFRLPARKEFGCLHKTFKKTVLQSVNVELLGCCKIKALLRFSVESPLLYINVLLAYWYTSSSIFLHLCVCQYISIGIFIPLLVWQ